MNFNEHSDLAGKHAFLSPSNYHWINYSEEKLADRYVAARAAQKGTELHLFAHEAIRLGIKLPETEETLNLYVNDAIGYKMATEQPLFFSPNCYGHADCICFRDGLLRIHDLKTGHVDASFHQLEVYAALFCLEYIITPFEIEIELRIYQHDDIQITVPFPEAIARIMEKIVTFDQMIEELKLKGAW
jgi:Protein of unknown function (DUF2800)